MKGRGAVVGFQGNFCNWFLPPAGIRTGEQIEKLLLSRVLKKEKECSENGSFLDTAILV